MLPLVPPAAATSSEFTADTSVMAGRKHSSSRWSLSRHNGHVARLQALAGALVVAVALHNLTTGLPYALYLVLGVVLVASLAMVIGPRAPYGLLRVAVPLLDLAWLLFALHQAHHLPGWLLPLLYVVVATATVRGGNWEASTTLAGAVTGLFALVVTYSQGETFVTTLGPLGLLAACALTVRLMAVSRSTACQEADPVTLAFYTELLSSTPEAILEVEPEAWGIKSVNPAAMKLIKDRVDTEVPKDLSLEQALGLTDKAFLKTCRQRLTQDGYVRSAVTSRETVNGQNENLTIDMTPGTLADGTRYLQVVINPTDEAAEAEPASGQFPGYDFSCHYIPQLTHEINNHLSIIRLSAEVATATGKLPDFAMIQQQVDHCQEALQTVVVQVLRASTPARQGQGTPTADLQQTLNHCLLLVRPRLLAHGIQLQLLQDDALLPRVRGHVYELQETLVRILSHGAETMADQEAPRLLSCHVMVRDDVVELTFADLGPGLKWAELVAINGHSGLGGANSDRAWSTLRESMARWGGTLTASNGLNGGARFRLTLPRAEGL